MVDAGDDELRPEAVDQPELAKRTQSTGVPSVAKPTVPSPKSISSTHSGRRVVIARADRRAVGVGRDHRQLEPGDLEQRAAQGLQALGLIPSSLVSRTFMRL